MLPSFIIIGAMKGGTASLYHYLNTHPQILMSSIKETDFFIKETNYKKGLEWYKSLFADNTEAEVRGEASPNYTKRHLFLGVPERMHQLLPNVKLIYILRDPVKRILSHYIHNYAQGRENRSLAEALAKLEGNNYLLTSKYYYQITAFLPYYSQDRILFITSELLKSNRQETLGKIFNFIGVDTDFNSTLFNQIYHTSSTKLRRPWLNRHIPGSKLRRVLKPFLPKSLTERTPFVQPTFDEATEAYIRDCLEEDVTCLKALTGDCFDGWSL